MTFDREFLIGGVDQYFSTRTRGNSDVKIQYVFITNWPSLTFAINHDITMDRTSVRRWNNQLRFIFFTHVKYFFSLAFSFCEISQAQPTLHSEEKNIYFYIERLHDAPTVRSKTHFLPTVRREKLENSAKKLKSRRPRWQSIFIVRALRNFQLRLVYLNNFYFSF